MSKISRNETAFRIMQSLGNQDMTVFKMRIIIDFYLLSNYLSNFSLFKNLKEKFKKGPFDEPLI